MPPPAAAEDPKAKWRAEYERKKQERIDRIRASSDKKIETGGGSKVWVGIAIGIVILGALAAAAWFLHSKGVI